MHEDMYTQHTLRPRPSSERVAGCKGLGEVEDFLSCLPLNPRY